MSYVDKDNAAEVITSTVLHEIKKLHPTDKVDTLRKIASGCNAAADAAQDYNEQHGVPERTVDQL